MPLPAARPCASVVFTFTMAPVTLFAIVVASNAPVLQLAPLTAPGFDDPPPDPLPLDPLPLPPLPKGLWLFGNELLDCEVPLSLLTIVATTAPTPAERMTSITAASAAPMRLLVDDDRGC